MILAIGGIFAAFSLGLCGGRYATKFEGGPFVSVVLICFAISLMCSGAQLGLVFAS